MKIDIAIRNAADIYHEVYLQGGASWEDRNLLVKAKATLEALAAEGYIVIGKLKICRKDDSFWLEEESV